LSSAAWKEKDSSVPIGWSLRFLRELRSLRCQRRSQEFDLGGYINCTITNLSWVTETKEPPKKLR